MPLQVIGAGFGRTGTLSLKLALEQLGFGPCYHMMELQNHEGAAAGWLRAARQEPMDWDAFLQGFPAVVDWPACAFYRELHAAFPAAKVILTVRDPDKWYASALETIWPFSFIFPAWLLRLVPPLRQVNEMIQAVIWQGTFAGRFLEPAYAKQVFAEHIEQVRQAIPPGQLLVFEVQQGWQPLCDFLGVPVPASPFPNVNDAEAMKQRMRTVRYGLRALYAVLLAGVAGVLYALLA